MSYVVVVTKPSHTSIILPLVKRMHPGRRIVGILDGTVSLLTFRYPRGLSMSDYPFVSAPVWRPSPERIAWGRRAYEMTDDGPVTLDADPFAVVRKAEAAICAEGDWYGCAANFDMLMRHSGGDALADRPHAVIPWLRPHQIDRPIEEQGIGSTHDETFVRFRDGGLAKRRFDWCFAVNSQAILGDAYRLVTGKTAPVPVGKYALQLLYALRDMPPVTEGKVVGVMHDWKGTGRYEPPARQWGIGSPISATQILEDLKDAGLVDTTKAERRSPIVSISDAGRRMLDLLHPDCRDADLPFRIRRWQEQGRDSHDAIDRYVRTLFGRQKRFLARRTSS